ncbi:MAG: TonB-dependent receptor [Acidobacteria bacterium]|nr:TonB-dependent receptor [Acidobacteriota bacterium]
MMKEGKGHSVVWVFIGLVSCFILTLPHTALAEDLGHAVIEGHVVDANGDAIAGAVITAREQQTGFKRSTTTDRSGRYRFVALPPGAYVVRAAFAGFNTWEYTNINVRSGQTMRRDFRLEPGRIVETIDVRGNDLLAVDTSRTVVGLTLSSDEIEDVPLNGRDPLDLVYLLASTQAPPFETLDLGDPATRDSMASSPQEAALFSVSGGRAYSNNITIDGFDNNDDRLARERTRLSLEAIEEVQIITNQFAAEYGRASGGRINFRTRGGSNYFHGAAFYSFQDESVNANSFFRNARGQSRLPFQRRETGGRFSGPLRRDRLFFFGAYERRDEPDTDAIFALLPVNSQLNPRYPLEQAPTGRPFVRDGVEVALFEDDVRASGQRSFVFGRLDYQPTSRHTLFLRFDQMWSDRLRSREQGATLRSALQNRQRNSSATSLQHNWELSANTINQLRFQYSALRPRQTQSDLRPGVIVGNSHGLDFTTFGEFANGFITGASSFPEMRAERRFQFADALSWRRGAHSLKFGADVMHLRSATTQLHLFYGFYNFPSFGEFAASRPSRFRQRIGEPEQLILNNIIGVFAQDEWRWRPNFTLSFGLRYDTETLLKQDKTNFGPRLAFAWDPFRSGKTALRGGFGVFYNRVLLRSFEDFAVESRILEVDLGDAPGATGPIEAIQRISGFPHVFPHDSQDPVLAGLIRPILDTRSLSPGLRLPYSVQASLGVEREISKNFVVEVNYVFNRTLRLWRDQNINAPIPPPGGLIEFLLCPPLGYPGIVVLADGRTAFDNRARQITNVNMGFVQFDLSDQRFRDVGRGTSGTRIFGLNALPSSTSTTNPIFAALNAVRHWRPNPMLGEIEQLVSDGRAIYHGLSIGLSKRFSRESYLSLSYTLSKLIDDVTLNTHSPMDEFNFRLERSLGTTDARHRFVLRGRGTLPSFLGRFEISPILAIVSGRPFNITTNGQDRNLNDNFTDRPHFHGTAPIRFIPPGDTAASEAAAALFTLSTIGSNGTLGRNAGRGPSNAWLNVRVSRRFQLTERGRLRPWVDVYNAFNRANFIMNSFYGPLDTRFQQSVFLQPRGSRKPRTIELGMRLEF